MLRPTLSRRERFLLYGAFGSGKSRTHCVIAKWARRTNSPARFFVLDSEDTMSAMRDGFPDMEENTEVWEVYDWNDCKSYVDKAYELVDRSRNDWLIVDTAGFAWDEVQKEFSRRKWGKELWEVFAERALTSDSGNPLGDMWPGINQEYQAWMGKVWRWPGHLLVTAKEEAVNFGNEKGGGWKDSKPIIDTFGKVGYKPKAQKDLGHQVHSVFRAINAGDEWRLHTVKDRERERFVNKKVDDFVMEYLGPIAKWEV